MKSVDERLRMLVKILSIKSFLILFCFLSSGALFSSDLYRVNDSHASEKEGQEYVVSRARCEKSHQIKSGMCECDNGRLKESFPLYWPEDDQWIWLCRCMREKRSAEKKNFVAKSTAVCQPR